MFGEHIWTFTFLFKSIHSSTLSGDSIDLVVERDLVVTAVLVADDRNLLGNPRRRSAVNLVVPDLRQQSGPLCDIDDVLCEDVSTLPVSHAVTELGCPGGTVAV